MKSCNAKAEGMKGDDRKKFMSDCLSGKDVPAKKMTQQEKMKVCNTKADGEEGRRAQGLHVGLPEGRLTRRTRFAYTQWPHTAG